MKKSYQRSITEALVDLGERISVARRASQFRQAELAERAGVSRSTLAAIEKGAAGVSIGAYLAVLWALDLLGDVQRLASIDTTAHRMMADRLPKRVRS